MDCFCLLISFYMFPKPHCRLDFRLRFHNMKENINMNTLSATEKQVTICNLHMFVKVPWLRRRAFGCQSLFLWTLKRSWTPKMTTRLLRWQGGMLNQDPAWFLSPGEILHTQKADTLCWITSTFLRWQARKKIVAEFSHRGRATQLHWVGFMMFLGFVNMTCAGKLLQLNGLI